MNTRRKPIIKTVVIPAIEMHEGSPFNKLSVQLNWNCPVCGRTRGDIFETISWDGSRRLGVSGWKNPCEHVDKYFMVLEEARNNGLNPHLMLAEEGE